MLKILRVFVIVALLTSCGQSNDPPYVGKWGGEPIASCDDPIVITTKTVSMEKGKTIPLLLDKEGAIVLEKDGPFLIPSKDGKQLTYSNPNGSGDSIELKQCKLPDMKPYIGKHDFLFYKVEVKKSSVMFNGKSVPFNLTDKGLVLEEPPGEFTRLELEIDGNKIQSCPIDKNGRPNGPCIGIPKK